MKRALDANVILRFVMGDHPKMSPRCRELFARIQSGEEEIYLPEAALCDVVWTLRSFYKWPIERIAAFVGELLALESIQMERKDLIWGALTIFEYRKIDFSDALIASEMALLEIGELYSYDRGFDRIEEILRVEP